MLDLMPKRGPLALNRRPLSVDDSDSGIGCPNVANVVLDHGATNGIGRAGGPDFDAIRRRIKCAVPNDLNAASSGAAR